MEEPRPRSDDKYSDSFMLHTVAPRYVYGKHYATFKSSKMLRMKTAQEIRFENLYAIVLKASGESGDLGKGLSAVVAEAEKRGKKLNRPTLYQILNGIKTGSGKPRNLGDDLARDIEDALRLERGWMDNPREMIAPNLQPSGIRPDILVELVMLIDKMSDRQQEMLLDSARELLNSGGLNLGQVASNES